MVFFEKINDRLRHQTTTGVQLREMDAFRGWACLAVLVGHVLSISTQNGYVDIPLNRIRFGGPGVFLFFFISGFLLFMKWGRSYYARLPVPSMKDYFRRRLLRIVPAYLANILVIIVFYGIVFKDRIFSNNGLTDILQHLFFIHNISVTNFSSINAVAWTLPIEMQYYIALPFLASWFYGRRNLIAAPLVVAASIAYLFGVYYIVSSRGSMDYFLARAVREQLATLLFMFVIGMSFSNLWLYIKTEDGRRSFFGTRRFGNAMLVMGLIALSILWYIRPEGLFIWGYLWTVPYVAACGMVVFGTLRTTMSRLKLAISNPAIEFVGIISYSLYLWHWPVTVNLRYWLPMNNIPDGMKFAVFSCTAVVLSIIAGVISYMLFEKPFLKVRSSRPKPHVKSPI